MYRYNLRQLRNLEIMVDRDGWVKAFEYIGYHGIDNDLEVSKVLEKGLIQYLVEYTPTKRELEEMDYAINYLCELYGLK